MTVLQALDRYYDRMAARGEAEAPGWSRQKIDYALLLDLEGRPVQVQDLRDHAGKRPAARLLPVPGPVKRTVGILPNLLWDKTAYVFGRTAGGGHRTAAEHAAFKAVHLDMLASATDAGLVALRLFLKTWTPESFGPPLFNPEMLDKNIVFRLDGAAAYLHERQAARHMLAAAAVPSGVSERCLVTGLLAPVGRLHPSIKGVEGAQSAGAALVSFNLVAFTSYGKVQGANAPVSEAAVFRYSEALNRMLDRGSGNRLPRPLGDATVVFWADTSDSVPEDSARAAEDVFAALFVAPPIEPEVRPDEDRAEALRLNAALELIADGRPGQADPRLKLGTRFHVLGLAPNAARLSVRFWLDDSFEALAQRLCDHLHDVAIEPLPWRARPPSVARLLVKTTALLEKYDNIPPLLAGEVMRAILTGGRYPRMLLAAALMRLRAGDDPSTGWHAAVIRAVLARDHRLGLTKEPASMSLNRDNPDEAYQLGRLFATLEVAQRMALRGINATIRDRYFGAASATPASVFPILVRGAQNHLSSLRKKGKGGWIEREIEEISDHIRDSFPRSLRLEAQGRFVLGYYHQRRAQFAGRPDAADAAEADLDLTHDTESES